MTFNSVPEHLEGYLGRISQGWSDADVDFIQVVRFDDQPEKGIATYATLGLSEYELHLKGGKTIRQELLISAHTSLPSDDVASFLFCCAEHIKERSQAALRGELINPFRPLAAGATVSAVYATNPTPFDDGFAELSNVVPPVIFVLLVPIKAKEVALIGKCGWNWFEDSLEAQDPDIWDFKREQKIAE
ncbi:suppressor of fused domain protein [Pararhizobium sp. A13]|uniref:suppressor of fused domain protein n=1 Tax=Pararhizobium sp. A13 TaxID=3133975 RepID=UPI0032503320